MATLLLNVGAYAQNKVFTTTISSVDQTDDPNNANDGDLSTKANVRASSGIAIGIGAYSGHIELQYPSAVPANTTTYIKIDTEANLLPALLGGDLGDVLSEVLGTVLIGNQEFTVSALNGEDNPIITGRSQIDDDFSQNRLRIVVDKNEDYYVAVTPNENYDRIRLTSRLGSLIGLGNTKRLGVYGAYYVTSSNECGIPTFTSFNGEGITLDLINLGGAGVENPHHFIDDDPNSYSELNLGLLSVAASIQQSAYFEGSSNTTDNFNLKMGIMPALLAVGALNNITIIASNNGEVVQTIPFSSLLNVDLLTLIQINANNGLPTTIPFSIGQPVDRITVRYTSLLNVEIAQNLDLYGITRTPALPVIDIDASQNMVCSGNTASLVATSNPSDQELRWYSASTSGTPLAITASGESFTTPEITEDTTFYVAVARPGCTQESARIAVEVETSARPTASDITVTGNEDPVCESSNVILVPSSSITGTFSWFFDADKTSPITDGLTNNGVTYNVDQEGVLTVNNLMPTDTPIDYYVSITDTITGCDNAAGDLAMATVDVIANSLTPSITIDPNITADDIININESQGTVIITGSVGGDVQAGDMVTLVINQIPYAGTVANDLTYSIEVEGSDLIADPGLTVNAIVETSNGTCTSNASATESYSIDTSAPVVPTVDPQTTNDTTPTITGTATSANNLFISVNGVSYTEGDGNLTDNGDDTWSLTIPTGNELPEGVYDVAVTATDDAGNTANDTTTDELAIDLTNPEIPTVNPLTTNSNTPTISGTASSEDELTVAVNGVTYTEGDGNLTDNGDDTWTLVVPDTNVIPDGVYDVMATATDNAGNTANDTTTDELTINSLAPDNPTVDFLTTNDNTPEITGTANSTDDLTVELDGITYTEGDGNLTDNGDDTWTLQIPDANDLTDGIYDINAVATQGALSANDATVNELTIDTTAPQLPTVDQLVTNDTTPEITGTASSEDELTVTVNGITYTEGDGNLTDNGDDTWALQIPDANELPDGVYDVMATATDQAGNTSNDNTTDELTIDSSLPDTPTVDTLATSDNTPTVTGTANSVDNLTVEVNEIVYTEGDGNLTDNGDDTWSLTIPDNHPLPDGFYDIVATVTDDFGNTNNDTTLNELTIDTSTPDIPTVNPLVTEDKTPTITGTANTADNLMVIVNGVNYAEGGRYLQDNHDNTWTLTIPEMDSLSPGVYDVVAVLTNITGESVTDNTTDELSIIEVGTGPDPTTPVVTPVTTNDPTPIITGTADSSDELTVELNGETYTEGDGNLTDNEDDTWELTVPEGNEIPEGTYDVIATVTNSTGGTTTDTTTDELTIEDIPVSDISIIKTVDNLNPLVGEIVTFTISVVNNGETQFSNTIVNEVLASGFTYQQHTASIGYYQPANGRWTIDALSANETATLTLRAQVNPTGIHTNIASIETSTPEDGDANNNSSEVTLELSCLTVFNEFTPNNDGYNDYFRIECIERYPNSELRIFNRYGNKVYETIGYQNDWTGIANVNGAVNRGKELPAGAYFYSLKIDELGEDKSGWLYIAK
ncbi:Ig-like domain-containing protein [Galbibacter pacificus]|uniref:Ig-like domain-containing protein n=1 Tax=Galbibacter pacificus TaxID=2996052 RepID=A0ABT6FWB5_9FLAO|nr:Ig-like domain-containing protein [Galbibacter pacificus]MDG3584011.1 Ig-like domain-containing protein [Galbibacter pacificus]MDG3587552.1 Ig-like domain-containing protein [Galbibacter pacificus]